MNVQEADGSGRVRIDGMLLKRVGTIMHGVARCSHASEEGLLIGRQYSNI